MEILTKENFWDEVEQKYPKAMAHFKAWINAYKSAHDWDRLISIKPTVTEFESKIEYRDYYDLPIAMQFGIFLEYWTTLCNSQTPCKILIPGSEDRLQSYDYYQGIRAYIIGALIFMEGAPI